MKKLLSSGKLKGTKDKKELVIMDDAKAILKGKTVK
ncbi:MAG: hypothetical protein RLZZ577_55 [Bacteroidota bacterium]|jgi:hypothetical protein